MVVDIFANVAPILAILFTLVYLYKRDYNKKHNIEEEVEDNKTDSNLKQKWKDSYIYLVFVKRIKQNKDRGIPLFFITIPSLFWIVVIIQLHCINPILKLDEMETQVGIVKKAKFGKGRANDSLHLLTKEGELKKYNLVLTQNQIDKIKNKEVRIWAQREWRVIWFIDWIYEIEVDGKLLKNYEKYFYLTKIKHKEEAPGDIVFWLCIALFGVVWTWFLNRKDFPIHKENKN